MIERYLAAFPAFERRAFLRSAAILVATLTPSAVPVAHAAASTVACGDVAGLISAINSANTNGQPDTINLAAGCTYTLTAAYNGSEGDEKIPDKARRVELRGDRPFAHPFFWAAFTLIGDPE